MTFSGGNMAKKRRSSKKRQPTWVSVVIILILSVVAVYNYIKENTPVEVSDGEIAVHTVDVGQGDCTIIVSSKGNIIIDAGTSESEDDLRNYVKKLGITEFEYAIFTHPHEDHIGGADMIVNEFEVKNVIMSNATSSSATFDRLLTAIEQSDANVIEAISGEKYSIGDANFTVLAPNDNSYSNLNDYSVVIRFVYGNTSFMFTGDAESLSENEILDAYPASSLRCDVLSAGHHGSSTSNSEDFVHAVDPDVVLISCGKGNSYGHPHKEVINLFDKLGAKVYRTDLESSIVIKSDGNTVSVIE